MCTALQIYVKFHSCQSVAIKRSDIGDTCMLWSVKERFYVHCILTCTSVNPHSTLASSNSGLMQCKSVVWPHVFRIRRSRDTNMLLSLKIGKLACSWAIICCKLNEGKSVFQSWMISLQTRSSKFYSSWNNVLTSAGQVVKSNILLLRQETILAQQMLKYQAITF